MSLPFFPMYPTDFEADTSHLSLAEDGAYNRLLRLMWMTPGCSLPDDDDWIMRRMRVSENVYRSVVCRVISEFMVRESGRVFSARLSEEWQNAHDAHQRRASAGRKGAQAKALKTKEMRNSNATSMPKQPEPEPDIEKGKPFSSARPKKPKPERFEEFWNTYPHRGGAKKGKSRSKQRYDRVVAQGIPEQDIIGGAARYASDRQVADGYAKNPETWLNNEGWKDEIEPSNPRPRGPGNHDRGRGSADGLMAGFAAFAADGRRSDADERGSGPLGSRGDEAMDRRADCDPSRPLLRVVAAGSGDAGNRF